MQLPIFWRRGQAKPWPSIPRINRAHPLAFGLATYCYDAGGAIVDLVNGGTFTPVGMTGGRASAVGGGYQFNLTGFGFMPPFRSGYINPFGGAAPYSAAVGTFYTSSSLGPGNPDCACVNVQSANNNEDTFLGFNTWPAGAAGNPASGNTCSFVINNTTNIFTAATNLIVPNTFQSWGWAATSSTTGQLYYNGAPSSWPGNSFTSTTFSGDTQAQIMYNTASINAGQTFGNAIIGFIPYFAMWGRALAAWEFLLLALDPWSLLIYPEDELFASTVGVSLVPGPGPNGLSPTWMMMGV